MSGTNEPQKNQNAKWIAISVIVLFALSGGVYQLSKKRGADQNTDQAKDSSKGATGPELANLAVIPAGGHLGAGGTVIDATGKVIGKISNPSIKSADGKAERQATGSLSGASLGAPGAPGATTPGVPAAEAPMPGAIAVVEKQDQCVTITYHHKALSSHNDEESCSHHKNMLKLAQIPALEGAHANAATVCVRVNGTPVHYLTVKGHNDELIFGSVAGPKSKVTVRYCTGKAQGCVKEDCTVPKDEFMEAIGGAEGGSQNAKLGQWDPDAPSEKEADVMAKLDGEVKKELETNDDLNGRAPAGELFKDWIGQTETAACGTTQAKN